jgi:hypothetical protein
MAGRVFRLLQRASFHMMIVPMKTQKQWKPDFAECVSKEQDILSSQLALIRSAIMHPGEKGGAVEDLVRAFLRDLLPHEYGLGTGFIAYHDPKCISGKAPAFKYDRKRDKIKLSGQLDVIIYDAIRGGPIIRLGNRAVYPLESVFAYVEVKANLDRKELRRCLDQAVLLRSLQTKFYRFPAEGTYTKDVLGAGKEMLSVRSHIFALAATGLPNNHLSLANTIKRMASRNMAFISGMYVGGVGYFQSHHCETNDDPQEGEIESAPAESALGVFKIALHRSLSRFPRIEKHWSAALDTYYQQRPPERLLFEGPIPQVPTKKDGA